ncbi:uncharacterized protein LOC125878833 [Epinephelus fuscoguttatus]|uniref:uncharacterized protein LOC125878833 n=1 Tax=Epinephelus fuscoguttatus TaxID=293821 RepID=UPI0020D04897|nr:uncharacterized protein LOC125878833 [Epinephelus fuscoguttatus]
MREHDWLELKKSHPPLRDFLKRAKTPQPLSPRDALYGGRTSAVRLRYTTVGNETVHYVDVTSLYPYVNCAFPYPLGHPEIVYRDFKEPQNYFGLIRAVVYPPRGLFFPMLPYKAPSGKLVFTLCRTCADLNFQAGSYTHDDEGRALTGVWVTPEFNKALELGYRLGKITEVWHFDRRSDNIFVEYMHTFLKGKQEASGYPAKASDPESRRKYIADYGANQGILLDTDKIQSNPAKRQVAKLCLNSLWGKFAQRSNLNQTVLVREPEEFFSYMFSEKHKVKYFSFLNKTTALIQWCHGDPYIAPPNKTDNVFIAAFTTAYGRLKLYDYLHQLQNRVLYLDTDSLIYVAKEGERGLKLGNYLGDLTDELGGGTIQEFVAVGPKSYAYLTRKNKRAVLRVKGITQTHECCEKINFDSVKELVEGYLQNHRTGEREEEEGFIETLQHGIKRDKNGFLLKNSSFLKRFRVVFDKRRLLSTSETLPFGY